MSFLKEASPFSGSSRAPLPAAGAAPAQKIPPKVPPNDPSKGPSGFYTKASCSYATLAKIQAMAAAASGAPFSVLLTDSPKHKKKPAGSATPFKVIVTPPSPLAADGMPPVSLQFHYDASGDDELVKKVAHMGSLAGAATWADFEGCCALTDAIFMKILERCPKLIGFSLKKCVGIKLAEGNYRFGLGGHFAKVQMINN